MLGWLPMVQGIKLQQLTLLVAGLLAACGACLAGGWLLLAGGLLALATIKPQLTWPLVLWLLLWAASDWRSRRRFVFGFGFVMLLLLGGAQLLLPGMVAHVRRGDSAISPVHAEPVGAGCVVRFSSLGRILEAACVIACAVCVWPVRKGACYQSGIWTSLRARAGSDGVDRSDVCSLQPGAARSGNSGSAAE